jgi:hypothetical protein
VTTVEGAVVTYTGAGTNGVDIVASFYDTSLDLWSWPRKLTDDGDTEKSISLAYDGDAIQFAYLKTQMLRTNVDVGAGGQTNGPPNVLRPGQTDLYLTRYSQGVDLGIVPGSLRVEPENPAPGSAATIRMVVENRGELPAVNIPILFLDYTGQAYYTLPNVTIASPLVGGATQEVVLACPVPEDRSSHVITGYIDTDSANPRIPDRDPQNNMSTLTTVLPDLVLSSISFINLSDFTVALLATVRNDGVVPASSAAVEWRGSAGEILGTALTDVIAPGQEQEVSCIWDTTGLGVGDVTPRVTALVDPEGWIVEENEANNERSGIVRLRPSWVPRITLLQKLVGIDRIRFESANSFKVDFTLESSDSLSPDGQWNTEAASVLLGQDGRFFYVDVPASGESRFYRIRAKAGRP